MTTRALWKFRAGALALAVGMVLAACGGGGGAANTSGSNANSSANNGKGQQPGKPTTPTTPTKPAQPSQPNKPANPTTPAQPGKPTTPVKPSQPGGTANTPVTAAGTYSLQSAPSSYTSLIRQANEQGKQGYALIGGQAFQLGQASSNLYVKWAARPAARLSYTTQPGAISKLEHFLSRLNTEGRSGWAFKHEWRDDAGKTVLVFVKDAARSARYDYQAQADTEDWTALLNQLNTQGRNGYRWVGSQAFGTGGQTAMSQLYMRTSGANATYSYLTQPAYAPHLTLKQIEEKLNQMGKQRAVLVTPYVANGVNQLVFERSSLQTGTLEYRVAGYALNETGAQMLKRHNDMASQGYIHLIDLVASDGKTFYGVYAKGLTLPLRHIMSGTVYPS